MIGLDVPPGEQKKAASKFANAVEIGSRKQLTRQTKLSNSSAQMKSASQQCKKRQPE